jgi:hypothetical protein
MFSDERTGSRAQFGEYRIGFRPSFEGAGARYGRGNQAKAFYEHFDFEPSPTDPYHLFLLMKDLQRLAK